MRSGLPIEARLTGLVQLTRPDKPLASGIYCLVGSYLSGGTEAVLSAPALQAASAVFFVTAFGFAINDYKDAEADRLTKPTRPIPSGRVSPRVARLWALLLALASLGLGSALSPLIGVFAFGLLLFSALYSYCLKQTLLIGNATVALLTAAILPFGALAVGEITLAVRVGFVLTLLFILAEEVFYTLFDEEADRVAQVRTTAYRLGWTKAVYLFEALVIAIGVGAVLLWVVGWAPANFLYALAIFTLLPLSGMALALQLRPTQSTLRLTGKMMRFTAYASVVPILLLR